MSERTRQPPQDVEAEMATLASMFLDRDVLGEVVQVVSSDQFYKQDHRLIFDALADMHANDRPVDMVMLRDELERRGQMKQIGGDAFRKKGGKLDA